MVVTSKDETGQLMQALGDMNASLYNIVQEVRNGTVATASAQISACNMDLSSRTRAGGRSGGSIECAA
ncbi:methyl-accepting chemotaxis protein [Duganella sp. 3397]|uniref:hypothetical protein n=1 Tax=Duganella sp. 3397 TaxID=2817732 RepID=UPI00285C358E|nr:hypothetical protein [Duganella sp. 3397]MDR7048411.1 methyl-accepting chemotaxis protein [Duganella sp. 3397]